SRSQSHYRGSRFAFAATRCDKSGSPFRSGACGRAQAARKILGAASGDEHGPALARSGQGAAGSRPARSGTWLVHRGLQPSRPEAQQEIARRAGAVSALVLARDARGGDAALRLTEYNEGEPMDRSAFLSKASELAGSGRARDARGVAQRVVPSAQSKFAVEPD